MKSPISTNMLYFVDRVPQNRLIPFDQIIDFIGSIVCEGTNRTPTTAIVCAKKGESPEDSWFFNVMTLPASMETETMIKIQKWTSDVERRNSATPQGKSRLGCWRLEIESFFYGIAEDREIRFSLARSRSQIHH